MKRTKIAILLVMATIIGAMLVGNKSFAGNNYTVANTEGKGVFAVITLDNGKQAFCVQRKVSHPVVGTKYSTIQYSLDNVENLFVAIHVLNDGTYDFKATAQIATWAYLEKTDFTNWVKLYVGTENALNYYNKILEVANQVDVSQFDVTIEYVGAEGYQILAIPTVSQKEVPTMTLELEEDDPYPMPMPTPEPEQQPQPEVVKPEVKVEETTPEPQPEVVPNAPVVEEEEILAETYEVPQVTAPQTGDRTNSTTLIVCSIMMVCAGAIILLIAKKRTK